MPYDITMCLGNDCPIKQNCLRFTGEILGRQDFFGRVPYNFDKNECEYFMDNKPSFELIQKTAYYLWKNSGCPENSETEIWLKAEKILTEGKK